MKLIIPALTAIAFAAGAPTGCVYDQQPAPRSIDIDRSGPVWKVGVQVMVENGPYAGFQTKYINCAENTFEACEKALAEFEGQGGVASAPDADDSAASSPSSSAAPATAPAAQPGSALAVPVGTVAYGGTSYQMIGGHEWAVKVGNSYVPCDSNSAQGCSAALSAHLGNQPKQPSPLDDDDGGGNGR